MRRSGIVVVPAVLLAGCVSGTFTYDHDFNAGGQGWQAGFADYPAGQEEQLELQSGIRALPDEVGPGQGYYLSGNNTPDDLFMFLKRPLGEEDGLEAGRGYDVLFVVRFASNAPSDCVGVGGSPGESVWLKVGVTAIEPQAVLDAEGDLRMNIDKGNQSTGGDDVTVAGNIANGVPCEQALPDPQYVSVTRSVMLDQPVTAGNDGELWLLIGLDSGFEGTTSIYFQEVEVVFVPRQGAPGPLSPRAGLPW